MQISFTKMHGAGNDFIVVDDRLLAFPSGDADFIARIAARRTGVGCEGVILLQLSEIADLRMRFFNPDGREVEMCGNGARCFARRAFELGAAPARMRIETVAGLVAAEVHGEQVCLDLTAPSGLEQDLDLGLASSVDFVNTGVPHAVLWVEDVNAVELPQLGRAIRFHERFRPAGTNANVAQVEPDGTLRLRTYERGVEAETLACGTGAAAVAVLAAHRGLVSLPVAVHCAGGDDLVIGMRYGRATLTGNAVKVFEGVIDYGDRV